MYGALMAQTSFFPRRRPDKLREMTYTQFWNLVRERKVDKVHFFFVFVFCTRQAGVGF